MHNEVIIYTDGGSRGNPGPSAIGVVIDLGGRGVKEYSAFLGERTNNEAEYEAVIFALKKLKALVGSGQAKRSEVTIYLDSALVASQLQGQYKIKEKNLYPLFISVWNISHDFASVGFLAVTRDKNRRADQLVNQALNG
jgi:ribonuclease HI